MKPPLTAPPRGTGRSHAVAECDTGDAVLAEPANGASVAR